MITRSAITKMISRCGNSQRFVVGRAALSSSAWTPASSSSGSSRSQQSTAMIVTTMTAAVMLALHVNHTTTTTKTFLHCQVPCGIFNDQKLVMEVMEIATTIRKAMVECQTLWVEPRGMEGTNQAVRWIMTKEQHCDKLIHLMGDYCLCQRVKPASFVSEQDYLQALKLHHNVMVAAMKAKQTMDLSACDALDHALEDLAKLYTP